MTEATMIAIPNDAKRFPGSTCYRTWRRFPKLLRCILLLSIVFFSVLIVLSNISLDSYEPIFGKADPNIPNDSYKGKAAPIKTAKETSVLKENVSEVKDRYNDVNTKINMNALIINEKQKGIVNSFKHAWNGYKKYAWGHDELRPLSNTYNEWFGVGLTILDSLDTMLIMGLNSEFNDARNWVASNLHTDNVRGVNVFEMTIRALGGLLSAYHLSNDTVFLNRAIEVGDKLMPAFKSRSGIPYSDVNFQSGSSYGSRCSLSEGTTIQLEFNDLSRLTKNNAYKDAAAKVMTVIRSLNKTDGLVPIFINADSGQFINRAVISLGARGDSYYEYLLKQWIQTGKVDNQPKTAYIEAMEGVRKLLVRKSFPSDLTFVGELSPDNFSPKMDHLVCFLPGTLALGYMHNLPEWHLELAKKLMYTCWQMYMVTATGLSPEIAYFNQGPGGDRDILIHKLDRHNLLRPETVESLFYLYRITNDTEYRTWGWQIFQAFERHTKVKNGYSSVDNVENANNPQYRDKMESFFLAETLKYLYLLFDDSGSILDLRKWVFNTEAHPLPIWT